MTQDAVLEQETEASTPVVPVVDNRDKNAEALAAKAAFDAAVARADGAKASIAEAMGRNDILAAMRFMATLAEDFEPDMVTLKRTGPIAKAQTAFDRISYVLRDKERDAAIAEIQETIPMVFTDATVAKYRDLKIVGATIEFTDDGRVEVSVKTKFGPAKTGSGEPRSGGGAGSRAGKTSIRADGGLFKTQEFLDKYSDRLPAPTMLWDSNNGPVVKSADLGITGLGAWCLYRTKTENWQRAGLKYSPGYDVQKRELMKTVGATFEDGTAP